MKIAIISHPTFAVPPTSYGGIQRGVYDLSIGLGNKGHKIILFCTENSTITHKNIQKVFIADKGLAEPNCKTDTKTVLTTLGTLLHQYTDEIDCINLRWESVEALKICNSIDKPVVLSISCILNENQQKTLYNKNTIFTCHTKTHAKYLKFIKNIQVSNYGISKSFIESDYKLENTLSLPKEYCVSIAGIQKGKGQKTIIEIAHKLNLPLVIAGKASDEPDHQKYYKENVMPKVNSKNVIYFGEANEQQKNELFRRANFSIVASGFENNEFNEPYGRVLAESLMNGCPVLGYKYGGSISEIVRNEVDGFLYETIPDALQLSKKIKYLDRSKVAKDAKKRLSEKNFVETMEGILSTASAY